MRLALDVKGEDATGSPFTERTHCLNVSGAGILFESRQKLLVGTRVKLLIHIPPSLREHFGGLSTYETAAVICRLEKLENEASVRAGARFAGSRA